ncbi:MAG: exo-alpha-sialidase [Ginsengibacter sp.]
MNFKNIFALGLLLLCVDCSIHAQQISKPPASTVQASVGYNNIPLMKRMPFNPFLWINIAVPENKAVTYKSIQLQLDENALKAIEKIDIVLRDLTKRGFLEGATFLASVKPKSAVINIPIDVTFKQGLNYISVSIVLKDDANIDKKINVKANYITESNGIKQHFVRTRVFTKDRILTVPANYISKLETRVGIAIRKKGDDSVNTYRIPGMITTNKGTLIAVYDIRYNSSRDLPGNIDVGMSRSTDGGHTWEPMKVIMDMGVPNENNGVGDPAVLFDPVTKKLWVAALWSKGNRSIAGSEPGLSPDTTGQLVLASSDDDGVTWSQPYSITKQVKDPKWHLYFNGPGAGITMQNGTLVFASQYWDETKKPGIPHSSIIYSEDHGKTWKSGTGAKSNTTEAQVVETTPGTLMLNMRDNGGNFRSVATTTNMGKTWIEHQTSFMEFIDPIAMASFIKARVNLKGKMKDVLFFCNVASETRRRNTTIKASLDLGETWWAQNELLIDIRTTAGYSDITKIDENTLGVLYEGDNGELYFLRIPVSDILK